MSGLPDLPDLPDLDDDDVDVAVPTMPGDQPEEALPDLDVFKETVEAEDAPPADHTVPWHVGLSVSRSDVTVAALSGDRDSWRVERFASFPLRRGVVVGDDIRSPKMVGNTIEAVWMQAGLPTKPETVRVAVEGPQVTFTRRPETLELTKRVAAGLTRGVIKQLGQAQPNQVIMTAPDTLTAAVREAMDGWETQPFVVASGFAAIRSLPINEDQSARLLLIADGERTSVVMERDGKVAVIRTYDGAGKAAQVDEWMKRGEVEEAGVIAALTSHALQAAYGPALAAEDELNSAFLAGPCATMPGLKEALSERLGVEVQAANPLEGRVRHIALGPSQQEEVAPRLTVAVGAAMLGLVGSRADLP